MRRPRRIDTGTTWPRSAQSAMLRRASGRRSARLLTTPGLNQEDLDAKLGGYVQTAENQVQKAEGLDPPGPDGRSERGRGRGAPVPRQRARRASDGVQADDRRDGCQRGGRESRRADQTASGERCRVDGLVPGSCRGGAPGGGHRRSRRPVLGVRHRRRAHHSERRSRPSGSASRVLRLAVRRRGRTEAGSPP